MKTVPKSSAEAIRARHGDVSGGRRAWLIVRSTVFWVWQTLTTLVMGAPVLIGCLVSDTVGYRFALFYLRLNFWGLRAICGVRWEVQGRENIPDQACVVLSKHQSTWDTYFVPSLFTSAVYVAKRSLIWIPIFGWSLWALRFILIDRSSGRNAVRQMVEAAHDRIGRGRFLIIFPEGTRRPIGATPKYRPGGAIVATEVGVPVLPIALNAGEFWPRMGFIKWPGTITVRIGEPIPAAGREASEVMAEAEAWIENHSRDISEAKHLYGPEG